MIKDIDYEIEIDESKKAEIETELITGELDSLILNSSDFCSIHICFKEFKDIEVFSDDQFNGVKMLPIRIPGVDLNGNQFNYSSEKITLNNFLTIYVTGVPHTSVRITLRIINYEEKLIEGLQQSDEVVDHTEQPYENEEDGS